MDISKLFTPDYLFDSNPGSSFSYMVIFIALFLAMIVSSFYLEAWMRKNSLRTSLKTTFPRLAKNIRNFGLVGFIFLWIRYENLPYLSMRFLFLLYLIWIVAYIGHNVYKFKTKLPEAIDKQHSTKKLKNYLPTKKKKGGKKKRK